MKLPLMVSGIFEALVGVSLFLIPAFTATTLLGVPLNTPGGSCRREDRRSCSDRPGNSLLECSKRRAIGAGEGGRGSYVVLQHSGGRGSRMGENTASA
jgi:hypothetical protein